MSIIADLKDRVDRVAGLLKDPEPGLATWNIAVLNCMHDLIKQWVADGGTLPKLPEASP